MDTHQSRWGFHTCSWQVYRKLKRLNFLFYMATLRDAAWERWNRKQPKNRVMLIRYPRVGNFRGAIKERRPLAEPTTAPNVGTYWDEIRREYANARYPVAKAEDVRPLHFTEQQIDVMLSQMEDWFAGRLEKAVA